MDLYDISETRPLISGRIVRRTRSSISPATRRRLGRISSRRLLTLLNPTVGPYYNSIIETVPGGNISYNGMVVKVQKRFSGRFTVQSNYTLGHCISDMDPDQFLDGQDYINWKTVRPIAATALRIAAISAIIR